MRICTRTAAAAIFLLILIPVITGCGDGRGARVPVSGTVTVDGQPLKFGAVTFLPETQSSDTRAGGGSLDENGRFVASSYDPNDGLMPGKYKVKITGTEPINELSQRWHAPPYYSRFNTSRLTAEITGETDSMNFELSWEGTDHSAPFVEKFQ